MQAESAVGIYSNSCWNTAWYAGDCLQPLNAADAVCNTVYACSYGKRQSWESCRSNGETVVTKSAYSTPLYTILSNILMQCAVTRGLRAGNARTCIATVAMPLKHPCLRLAHCLLIYQCTNSCNASELVAFKSCMALGILDIYEYTFHVCLLNLSTFPIIHHVSICIYTLLVYLA